MSAEDRSESGASISIKVSSSPKAPSIPFWRAFLCWAQELEAIVLDFWFTVPRFTFHGFALPTPFLLYDSIQPWNVEHGTWNYPGIQGVDESVAIP